MKLLIAFVAGLLMSLGMAISKMIDPQKVLSFLDITGNWDPSLALVMASALAVYSIGFYFVMKKPAPLFEKTFYLPTHQQIDRPLLVGAALFGIGWGMVGYCPGPAISAISSLSSGTLGFIATMIIGWFIAKSVKLPQRNKP
ncbi:hypothetical protein GCM10010919_18500 [Alishewanella longhuensis]|uniref:Transporter n=1 Tax=Alishewanella longhuensis TaxID=1091037 RepID=A0ABQ3KZE1_9ALTE|nr:DUF6691 family protein [Alishewanella longhuensis]GHG68983.1 hypothetical protein GCM10010919_18500 [Alishewanella longhuensis]